MEHLLNVGLAVSGGTDSLTMMHLAHKLYPAALKIVILTIDHGLRPESAQETDYVAKIAQKRGFECHILRLTLGNIQTDIQNQARIARYKILAQTARTLGLDMIAIAHHQDDMCETMLSRLLHQSLWQGLAPMADYFYHQKIIFHRPLLSYTRAELEDYCHINHLIPVQDPSNFAPYYERTHIRQFLKTHPDVKQQLIRLSEKTHAYRLYLQAQRDMFLKHHVHFSQYGYAQFSRNAFDNYPTDVQKHILEYILKYVSGKSYIHVKHIFDKNSTIAGVYCHVNKQGFYFVRESRNLPKLKATAGETILFDNRYLITLPESGTLSWDTQNIPALPVWACKNLPCLIADTGRYYGYNDLEIAYRPVCLTDFSRDFFISL